MREKIKKFPVTTTLSQELYKLATEKGLNWNECLAAGVVLKANQENIFAQLVNLEEGNKKLQDKLTKMSMRIYELEEEDGK